MPSTEPVLRASGLSRRFGYRSVLTDISFSLHRGDVLMLVGPNGAGKTTLLRVLAGLLRPTAGRVEAAVPVGVVMHDAMLYPALTARENLQFFARLYDVQDAGRPDELLELVDLLPRGGDRVQTFSRGMVQRLTIARALLHDPRLLLFDEPFSGIDESGSAALIELLAGRRDAGTAMMLVTHRPDAIRPIGTHLARLDAGRLGGLEPLRAGGN